MGSVSQIVDVVVLGAGAAGLLAATTAGARGRRVLVLDHGDRPGRKILISGGGRCNFTNLGTTAENFLGENPHFARSALAGYPPSAFLALVERHGIAWHEKTLGQLFCDTSAREIVTLLERECAASHVEIRCNTSVLDVVALPKSPNPDATPRFELRGADGLTLRCASVIVATGGLSIPKLGATGFGYELARHFGHRIVEPRPALVPLTFSADDRERWCDLAGLSADVTLSLPAPVPANAPTANPPHPPQHLGSMQPKARPPRTPTFREKLLVTHRGLSGPAVLQISSYLAPGRPLAIDLAPGEELLAPLRDPRTPRTPAALITALRRALPSRLAERWVAEHLHTAGEDWTNAGLARTEAALHRWTLTPAGTEGFAKAEVTAGGVATDELVSRTLESRRTPGLFFIGEVVDITGWLGGYNFQWAWASAAAAGRTA